jgi:hypothetical protein
MGQVHSHTVSVPVTAAGQSGDVQPEQGALDDAQGSAGGCAMLFVPMSRSDAAPC